MLRLFFFLSILQNSNTYAMIGVHVDCAIIAKGAIKL